MSELEVLDATLFYEQSGSGPDLVWVPGGDQPGSDWRRYQVPHFDGRFRNTTYDPRGVGKTKTALKDEYSIAEHAGDLAALIRAACDPPVVVIGLSMGALITQEIALSYPELVRGAIAMGTGGGFARSDFGRQWMRAEIDFRRAGGTLPEDFAIAHYAAFMFPPEALADAETWERVRPVVAGAYGRRSGPELAAQWEGCMTFNSADRLPSCQVPLHVIGFSLDAQGPWQGGRQVAELAPLGQFHLLEGLGHCSAFGHRPDEVNACLDEILAGLE